MPVVSDGEDLVSRARSIFARLRDDAEVEPEDAPPDPSANGATVAEASTDEELPPEPEPELPPDPGPSLVEAAEESPPPPPTETAPALPERLVAPEEIPEPTPPPAE